MVSVDVATADVTFGVALTLANAAVAALNAKAFDGTRDLRDALAALAWAGSTLYWALRTVVAVAEVAG